eukprot:TRINITY_DN356_c0_g1_i11.p1 TRINITY_DN356_c0_g1~~TRINITY_DN356_c0_g1_i11.p1  ORF type:complete len:1794 (+),score=373.90 TRINITY_DN356_c0_g1_i11:66-5384(+)
MSSTYETVFDRGVLALVECAKDGNEEVRDHITSSLLSLAQKNFGSVLDVTCKFLVNNKSTPTHQRITLLRSLRKVCLEYDEEIGDKLMTSLVACGVTEMTAAMDINAPWQNTACQLVVDLMCISPEVCIPYVINQIPGTSLPHYFIMKSLSMAAAQRPIRFIPHMKDCMAKVLPILGMAKQDNVRFMMADALASFAEAVSQLSNLPELSPRSQGADKHKLEDYNESMYTSLSLLVNDWSSSRELKVRTAVAMAMGKLSVVVDKERLEERLAQLVKLLTAAVKKEKPRDLLLPIKGMTFLITACMDKIPNSFQPNLEAVWQSVFQHVVVYYGQSPGDQTEFMKNHQELMMSIEAMSLGACNSVLTLIQGVLDVKFGSKDVITRCAALGIIRHLVQRQHLDEHLAPLKNNVIAIVRTCLDDVDYRMKKVVIQTIMAMGTAAKNNYLACEGAETLLEYLISHAATPPHVSHEWSLKNKKLIDLGQPSPEELRELAQSVMSLFNTTQPNLDTVFWPYILEVIGMMPVKSEFVYAFPVIASTICHVCKRLGNSHDFYFDFDRSVNVPKPEALISIFVVMMSQPQHLGIDATITIVKSMEAIAPLLDEPMKKGSDGSTPIGSLWLGTLPEIRAYLLSDEFKQEDYEDACHNLLKKSAAARKEEAWVQALVAQMGNQLPLWTPSTVPAAFVKERHDLKRVALSMFGLVLSKANLKTFVSENLNLLTEVTDHTNEAQRNGCAKSMGSISATHTDVVLDKVGKVAKPPKQSGGGFFSKKVDVGPDRDFGELSRATALLAYGHISRKSPFALFTSRFETHVVPTFLEVVGLAKNPIVKLASMTCQQMLGSSLRKGGGFTFTSKTNVMMAVLNQMLTEQTQYSLNDKTSYQLLVSGYSALIPTTYIDPQCDDSVLKGLEQALSAGICKEWAATEEEPLPDGPVQKQLALLGCAILESSKDIITSLISHGVHLSPFMNSTVACQRERSCRAYIVLLKHFGKQCDHRGVTLTPCTKGPVELGGGAQPQLPVVANTSKLSKKDAAAAKKKDSKQTEEQKSEEETTELSIGSIIGRLVPRLADTVPKTRSDALEGLSFCVKLHMMTSGQDKNSKKALDIVKSLSGKLSWDDDSSQVVVVMKDVTTALSALLVQSKEFPNLVEMLIVRGLVDPVEEASVAVCAILKGLFTNLGGIPKEGEPSLSDAECKLFLHKMIAALTVISQMEDREDTYRGTLLAIRALAKMRPSLLFNELLIYPVPHEKHITSVIQTISSDTGLSGLITNHCLDVLLNAQLFDEYKSGGVNMSICSPVIASAWSLGEVFQTAKGAEVAKVLQAPLLCSLLLLLAATHEAPKVQVSDEQQKRGFGAPTVPSPELVTTALEIFTQVAYPKQLVADRFVEDYWKLFHDTVTYPYATASLLVAIVHSVHTDGNTDMSILLGQEPVTVLPPTTSCPLVNEIFDFIVAYVQKVYDSHRRCAMCVVGQLLYHCQDDQKLLQGIINSMLSRAGIDEKLVIKLQAVQGFTHIPVHSYDAIKLFIAPVIGSLVACCGDPHLDVALAAMGTLETLIQRIVCKQELSAVIVNVCLRTKSALDSPDLRIRAAGCSLFGVMTKLAVQGTIDYQVMEANIMGHLPGLLVHVNDEEVMVRNTCKTALHEVVAYLRHVPPAKKAADYLQRLFNKEHMQPLKQTNYDEFINEWSKIYVRFYAHRVNDLLVSAMGYFQSPWAPCRSAAALLNGTLLRHLSDSDQARSNLEASTGGLITLMRKDPDPQVRTKAAKALGMLGDMA